MKARGWVLSVVGAVAVGLLSGCSGQAGTEAESGLSVIDDLATPGEVGPATQADVASVADDGSTRLDASGLAPVAWGDLTAEEAAGLVLMRAEEKLAHDLDAALHAVVKPTSPLTWRLRTSRRSSLRRSSGVAAGDQAGGRRARLGAVARSRGPGGPGDLAGS